MPNSRSVEVAPDLNNNLSTTTRENINERRPLSKKNSKQACSLSETRFSGSIEETNPTSKLLYCTINISLFFAPQPLFQSLQYYRIS